MLLRQAPLHPSNGSLDFVSLPRRAQFPPISPELWPLCSASFFIPTSTNAQEFSPKCSPFSWGGGFYFFGAVSTVPLLAARPHPVFLLEVSAVTNRRVAGVYSASALGVMGAVEPRPLGRTLGSSRRLSPAPSAPHHSLMQKTGLFSPGVKVPPGYDFTVPTF